MRGLHYNVVAAAFTKKGNLLGVETNGHRFQNPTRRGSGQHAERALIEKFGRRAHMICILRTNNSGGILPIHPCPVCAAVAAKYGIKIIPLHEEASIE